MAAPTQLVIKQFSHLLAFASYSKIDTEDVDVCMDLMQEGRGYNAEHIEMYRQAYWGYINSLPSKGLTISEWSARQIYILMAYAHLKKNGEWKLIHQHISLNITDI